MEPSYCRKNNSTRRTFLSGMGKGGEIRRRVSVELQDATGKRFGDIIGNKLFFFV